MARWARGGSEICRDRQTAHRKSVKATIPSKQLQTDLGSINPDKVDLSLVLPGNGFNRLGDFLSFGIGCLHEDIS